MAVVEVCGSGYYIHNGLKKKWDTIREGKLAVLDEDRVYVVDGREGVGKSLWTIQQAAYIDPTILEDEGKKILPRICFSAEETLFAIRNTKSDKQHTKVIIFDEAFRGLSNKSALSRMNRVIVQTLMEMRQNNLVLFIVSPSFFLLEMYAAMIRSIALFHIYKDKKSGRRVFKVFNYPKKNMLYQTGIRLGWNYKIYSRFKGLFFNKYPSGDLFEAKYRKKKFDSFKEASREMEAPNIVKNISHVYMRQRNKLVYCLFKEGFFKSVDDIRDFCKRNDITGLPQARISSILRGKEDMGLFAVEKPLTMSEESFEKAEDLIHDMKFGQKRDINETFSDEIINMGTGIVDNDEEEDEESEETQNSDEEEV
jgi:hypothetical protein